MGIIRECCCYSFGLREEARFLAAYSVLVIEATTKYYSSTKTTNVPKDGPQITPHLQIIVLPTHAEEDCSVRPYAKLAKLNDSGLLKWIAQLENLCYSRLPSDLDLLIHYWTGVNLSI